MRWQKIGEAMMIYTDLYVCRCEHSHDLWIKKDKEITDENGKRKTIKVKTIISERFFDKFSKPQFDWTTELCISKNPKMDYHEFFEGCRQACLRHYRETGEAKIFTSDVWWR